MSASVAKPDHARALAGWRAMDISPERADEAARYIGQMAGEMALLARGARLDLLAYFLEMARIEAHTASARVER